MSIWTEMRPIGEIKSLVKAYQRIAIIGCGGCMNVLAAQETEDHIVQRFNKAMGEWEYPGLESRLGKLKDVLTKEGKLVSTHAMQRDRLPCKLDWDRVKPFMTNKDILTSDVILAVTCALGRISLRKMFPKHKIIRAIGLPKGIFYYEVVWSDNDTVRTLVPSSITLIRE